jgi:hypothetical protein
METGDTDEYESLLANDWTRGLEELIYLRLQVFRIPQKAMTCTMDTSSLRAQS